MSEKLVLQFDRDAASLNEKAYGALEDLIVSGVLPPGSQWSEASLSEKIGVGRTPTREALQKLAYQRLVRIAPRQGVFVSEIDYQGQLKVVQARREIERLVVGQASQFADDAERKGLDRISLKLDALKAKKDVPEYLRLHFALTGLLGQASRNPYAAEFYSSLQTLARRFMNLHQDGYGDFALLCDLHVRQIAAVLSRDAVAAIASADERNDYAEKFARKILMELIEKSGVTVSVAR